MKLITILIMFIPLSGLCSDSLVCRFVNGGRTNGGVSRCENKEVICYIYHRNGAGGMSCKFK